MGQPDIVLICADEMNAAALRAYGNRASPTPFLEQLAQRGVRFDQCHSVHTKCMPSRCALLTGQYPHVGGHRTLYAPTRPHEPNLVRRLREAGYTTALFGRNHVVDAETMRQTFDVYVERRGRRMLEPTASAGAAVPPGTYYVGASTVPLDGHVDVTTTADACAWLGSRPTDGPLFAWINLENPHPPYGVPPPYFGRTDRSAVDLPPAETVEQLAKKPVFHRAINEAHGLDAVSEAQWRELRATYLDMCGLVDDQVRRVFDTLERRGSLQNTIFMVWADHGDFAGEHRLVEKWDTAFYDCITRVPWLLHAPGLVEAGACGALVESIDLLPTALDLAGVGLPGGVQGRSVAPVLRGETDEHRQVVLTQGGQERALLERALPEDAPRPAEVYKLKQRALRLDPSANARAKSIRDHDWRYSYRLDGPEELYDLRSDPHELENLAGDPAHDGTLTRYRLKMMEKLVEAETVDPYQDFLEA